VSEDTVPPELRAEFEDKDNTSGPTSEAAPSVLSAAPSGAVTDASTASATGAKETPKTKKDSATWNKVNALAAAKTTHQVGVRNLGEFADTLATIIGKTFAALSELTAADREPFNAFITLMLVRTQIFNLVREAPCKESLLTASLTCARIAPSVPVVQAEPAYSIAYMCTHCTGCAC
jgi:hypothetical protein